MKSSEIYRFVRKMKRKYCTDSPYEIAEALGIEIDYKPFEDLKGVYFISSRNPYIYLSDSLDSTMEKLVLFHELGHHFLHRHLAEGAFQEFGFYDMASKPEIEANVFAANFIIEDEDVELSAFDGYTTQQLASDLCVPHELLLIKIMDMNSRGYSFNLPYIPKSNFLA